MTHEKKIEHVQRRRGHGLSLRKLGKEFGCSHTQAARILKQGYKKRKIKQQGA